MLITHYTRILRHITPDFVHVFAGGRIVESGGSELADQLEEQGYVRFTGKQEPARSADATSSSGNPADARLGRRDDPQGLPDPVPDGARRQAAGVPGHAARRPRSRARCSTRS